MKKIILSLQVITIIGMVISMVVMFKTPSNDTIIKSIFTFIGFACVGFVLIILDEKILKKSTN